MKYQLILYLPNGKKKISKLLLEPPSESFIAISKELYEPERVEIVEVEESTDDENVR